MRPPPFLQAFLLFHYSSSRRETNHLSSKSSKKPTNRFLHANFVSFTPIFCRTCQAIRTQPRQLILPSPTNLCMQSPSGQLNLPGIPCTQPRQLILSSSDDIAILFYLTKSTVLFYIINITVFIFYWVILNKSNCPP